MPMIEQIQCDCGCNAIRQPSNHWRMVRKTKSGEWIISPWREGLKNHKDVKYAAGQACAHTLLDQFLSATPKPTPPIPSEVA
jgi:hypothetical protein